MRVRDFYRYKDPQILRIIFLGFSSGLPFLLLLSTLSAWLAQSGVSKSSIGMYAWVTFPYTIKFLIAPFVDQVSLPMALKGFGQRRGWLLLTQIGLMLSLYSLSWTDPIDNMYAFILVCLVIGVLAATQDIIIEAYRIESLPDRLQGYGSGAIVLGFRLGMLASGSIALYLAHYNGWHFTYAVMSLLMLVGIIVTLVSPEPIKRKKLAKVEYSSIFKKLGTSLEQPIKELYNSNSVGLVFIFIFSFKIGDTVLNTMSMPFLLEIGFSNLDMASIAKTFGITSMIIGGIFGGIKLSKNGLKYGLVLSSVLLILSSFMFAMQWHVGASKEFLLLTIGLENFACGVSQASLIAYLSYLCGKNDYTATKFALLSSFASMSRILLSTFAGVVADYMSWGSFYMFIAILCVIPLVILTKMKITRTSQQSSSLLQQSSVSKSTVRK